MTSIQPLEIKRQRFENGLVLVGNETKVGDSIALSGSIKAGSIYDAEGKFGGAELTTRLLTLGTNQGAMNASKISQRIRS